MKLIKSLKLISFLVLFSSIPVWSTTLVLPFRINGDFSKTGFSKSELSKGFMELSWFYGTNYVKMDFLPLFSLNNFPPVNNFHYWNKLNRKKLSSICQSSKAERIIAGDVFFASKRVYWKSIFYSCSSGRLSFKSKSVSELKTYLRGFFEFNEIMYRGFAQKKIRKKNKKQKEEIILLLDSSGKNHLELNSIQKFLLNKIYDFDFARYSLTIISLSPSGSNLYYHLDMPDERLKNFFQRIKWRGHFKSGLPLHSAINKIISSNYKKGQVYLFTGSYPHEKVLQVYNSKQVIRLYRANYRFNVIAYKGLSKKAFDFYRKLSRLGGGRISSLLYSQKIVKSDGNIFFLNSKQNEFYISNKELLHSGPINDLEKLISKNIIKPLFIRQNDATLNGFEFALNYLQNKNKTIFLKKYPLMSNIHKYLSKILTKKNSTKNLSYVKKYLMKSSGKAFWISCSKHCQELDALELNKEIILGISIQDSGNSYQYFSNNPEKIVVMKNAPFLLQTSFLKLIKNKRYYQNYGFEPVDPLWFIKCKKIDSKISGTEDIRD